MCRGLDGMTLQDIDITFDIQTITREGKAPDSDSKTLRSYRHLLWRIYTYGWFYPLRQKNRGTL